MFALACQTLVLSQFGGLALSDPVGLPGPGGSRRDGKVVLEVASWSIGVRDRVQEEELDVAFWESMIAGAEELLLLTPQESVDFTCLRVWLAEVQRLASRAVEEIEASEDYTPWIGVGQGLVQSANGLAKRSILGGLVGGVTLLSALGRDYRLENRAEAAVLDASKALLRGAGVTCWVEGAAATLGDSLHDQPVRGLQPEFQPQDRASLVLRLRVPDASGPSRSGVVGFQVLHDRGWRECAAQVDFRLGSPSATLDLPGVAWSRVAGQGAGWSRLARLDVLLEGPGHFSGVLALDEQGQRVLAAADLASEVQQFSDAAVPSDARAWLVEWLRAETALRLLEDASLDLTEPLGRIRRNVGRAVGRVGEDFEFLAWLDGERDAHEVLLSAFEPAMGPGKDMIAGAYSGVGPWAAGDGSMERHHGHSLALDSLKARPHPWSTHWAEVAEPWFGSLRAQAEGLPEERAELLAWLVSVAEDCPPIRSARFRSELRRALEPAFSKLEELFDPSADLEKGKNWNRLVRLARDVDRAAEPLPPSFIRSRLAAFSNRLESTRLDYLHGRIHAAFELLSGRTDRLGRDRAEDWIDGLDSRLGSKDPLSAWIPILTGERIRERADATESAKRRLEAFDQALKPMRTQLDASDEGAIPHPLGGTKMKPSEFALFGAARIAFAASDLAVEFERAGGRHPTRSAEYRALADSLLDRLNRRNPMMMTLAGNRGVQALREMR